MKVVAVDLRRGRVLERTRLAALVALGELAVLATLATAAVLASSAAFWWPVAVAAPLVAVQGAYEIRSRGRRLVPEVAGSVGVCAVAAMAVLADGGTAGLALGAWLVLAGRAVSSVTWVRGQIMRLHGRAPDQRTLLATDAGTERRGNCRRGRHRPLVGRSRVVAVIAVQRAGARGEPMRPSLQGMQQMAMGLGVVILAATGVLIA
ncbi:MAG: YwiC-like family protein [Microthrixaceae bacterium]